MKSNNYKITQMRDFNYLSLKKLYWLKFSREFKGNWLQSCFKIQDLLKVSPIINISNSCQPEIVWK